MRFLGIRNKILILIVSVFLLNCLLIGVFIYRILFLHLSLEMKERSVRLASYIANQGAGYVLLSDNTSMLKLIDGFERNEPDIIYVFVNDGKGEIFTHTFKEGIPPELKNIRDLPVAFANSNIITVNIEGKKVFDISVPISKGNLGYVHVGVASFPHGDFVKKVFVFILLSLSAGLFLSVLFVYLFSAMITQPISDLVRGVKAVSEGDFKKEIEVKENDEIAELARAFNKMAENLRQSTISRDHFDSILQSLTDALFVCDTKNRIKTVNKTLLELLGYTKEEICGEHVSRIFPESFEEVTKLSSRIENGEDIKDREFNFVAKGGHLIGGLFSGLPIRGRDGSWQGFVGIVVRKGPVYE